MSGLHGQGSGQGRRRRPPRTFVLSTDLRVQDRLEGTVRLRRGFMCQEQAEGRSRGADWLWVKVLDSGLMLKVERRFLLDVPAELSGLLEPVSDPEARLKLLNDPGSLQQLAALPADAPLWVQTGQQDELVEAELKYVGPLTRGSSSVFFGVQLKGSAAGKGASNGSYKGQRLFTCPDACALFLPVSDIRLRHWTSRNGSDAQERGSERDHLHPGNGHQGNNSRPSPHHPLQQPSRHISFHLPPPGGAPEPLAPEILPRTGEAASVVPQVQTQVRRSALPPPPLLHVGQRVCFPLEDTLSGGEVLHGGEVRFCGVLPGRSSAGKYVGILLDAPVGNWDGLHQGQKLCHIPSVLYGLLLPITSVSSETTSQRQTPPHQRPKPVLKPVSPPGTRPSATSPPAFASKVAMMPPSKPATKPPPLPPPKPALKPLPPVKPLPPPLPPPKRHSPTSPTVTEQLQCTSGIHDPASPLPSPVPLDTTGEEEEALEVGSMVEVNDPPIFGVICWIGRISGIHEPVAGIELDQELSAGTDGSYLGERHFRCPANKGLFVKLRNCRRDSRFPAPETPVNQVERCNSIAFAEWGSERVEEDTPPVDGDEARERYQGWKRGIQGHLNSCYLDATLFSLFSCCSSADWVLFWPCDTDPTSHQAQDLLRCEVVNPLRRFGYVCASKTMALRRLLEATDSNTGFTSQEKDPEEFLNRLFQLLRVEPLLKIRSTTQQPQECHLYQLFPPALPPSPTSLSPGDSPPALSSPSSSRMRVAGVQTLLESSFLNAGLKFVEAPSCLLLLMPRFGKDFKMFDAILPTLSLDITDLLDDTLRQCSICQAAAQWECLQCYTDRDITPGRIKQFCPTCNTQVHSHRNRTSHSPVQVSVPGGPWPGSLHGARQTMSLFSVTSIETSHYVSFVRHGALASDWMFFDSMSDREGGENGFNVPRVMACPEVGRYLGLSEEELSRVDPASLREPARRLLCDSYMCLYHSPELSLYK